MKAEKVLKTLLTWLPSLVISIFFTLNAFDKIFYSDQLDKIISNSAVVIMVGVFLLVATVLFLYDKTIIYGVSLLAIYMTCIVFIHLLKGKPFEVVLLMVVCIVFAAYIRKPQIVIKVSNDLDDNN